VGERVHERIARRPVARERVVEVVVRSSQLDVRAAHSE
jgi:hypothetical protein